VAALDAFFRQASDVTGVEFWLAYGSLLGAYRSSTVIPHDDDFDVGFAVGGDLEEATSECRRVIRQLSTVTTCEVPLDHPRHFLADLRPYGAAFQVDIFPFWQVSTNRIASWFGVRDVPAAVVDPGDPVMFEGRLVPAPRSPEALLATVYGADWRVPDSSFQWRPDQIDQIYADRWRDAFLAGQSSLHE
jgi:hypothetical protein